MHLALPDYIYCHGNAFQQLSSRTADSSVSEKHLYRLLVIDSVRARLTVLMAALERKHNACGADIGRCFSGDTYISRVRPSRHIRALVKS